METETKTPPQEEKFVKIKKKDGQAGKIPKKGDTVTVHCTGYGKNGDLSQVFWSTKDKGQTAFSFKVGVGQVIKGWDEAVIAMELDEELEITCPSSYAYGANGFPAWGLCTILPHSTLKFDIKLIKITPVERK